MLKKKQIISSCSIHNTLSEGTILTGDIKAEEDFRIDGVVEGTINCNGKIVIGPKGSVNGQINCISAELSGKLRGTIQTTGVLVIKSTAFFWGDATAKTMEIESGAVFNGTCKMVDELSPDQ